MRIYDFVNMCPTLGIFSRSWRTTPETCSADPLYNTPMTQSCEFIILKIWEAVAQFNRELLGALTITSNVIHGAVALLTALTVELNLLHLCLSGLVYDPYIHLLSNTDSVDFSTFDLGQLCQAGLAPVAGVMGYKLVACLESLSTPESMVYGQFKKLYVLDHTLVILAMTSGVRQEHKQSSDEEPNVTITTYLVPTLEEAKALWQNKATTMDKQTLLNMGSSLDGAAVHWLVTIIANPAMGNIRDEVYAALDSDDPHDLPLGYHSDLVGLIGTCKSVVRDVHGSMGIASSVSAGCLFFSAVPVRRIQPPTSPPSTPHKRALAISPAGSPLGRKRSSMPTPSASPSKSSKSSKKQVSINVANPYAVPELHICNGFQVLGSDKLTSVTCAVSSSSSIGRMHSVHALVSSDSDLE